MAGTNIDVSGYQKWEKVVMPDGTTLYAVPGTGYAYDPFLSHAKGRSVFRQNPKAAIDAQNKAQKQADNARSPLGQIAPIGYGIGGTLAGAYAIDRLGPTHTQPVPLGNGKVGLFDGKTVTNLDGTPIASTATNTIPGAPTTGTGQAFMSSAMPPGSVPAVPVGAEPVMTPVSPGFYNQSPSTMSTAQNFLSSAAPYLQGGLGALGAYQGYQNFQNGDKIGGGLGMATGAANMINAYGGAGSATAGSALPYLNAALGAYQGYNILNNDLTTDSDKATKLQQQIGRSVADYYTFGGASLADNWARKQGALKPVFSAVDKIDKWANPVTILADRFGSSKGGDQLFRDQARKEWKANGILDDNYMGELADGSKFDFGKDGKGLTEINYDDSTTQKAIGLANTLSNAEGFTGKATPLIAKLYTGAAMSNANGDYETARQNIQHFAAQRGLTPDTLSAQLQQLKDDGKLTDSEFQVYNNNVNEIFRPAAPTMQPTLSNPNPAEVGKTLAARINARK